MSPRLEKNGPLCLLVVVLVVLPTKECRARPKKAEKEKHQPHIYHISLHITTIVQYIETYIDAYHPLRKLAVLICSCFYKAM
jgi:hypothetical protein